MRILNGDNEDEDFFVPEQWRRKSTLFVLIAYLFIYSFCPSMKLPFSFQVLKECQISSFYGFLKFVLLF